MTNKEKIDFKAEFGFYLSILMIVLLPSILFFFIVLQSVGTSIPVCLLIFIITWAVPIFFLFRTYYLKEKDCPEDKNQLIKFGEKVITENDRYLKKTYRLGSILVLYIVFTLMLQISFFTIFNAISIIIGAIFAFLLFSVILIIDFILFNELKFSIYGKRLGLTQTKINLLYLDLRLNASKDKEKFLKKFPINKYCAIKKGICKRNLIYYGSKSCFFAFPFRHPFSSIMSKLKIGLEKTGFRVKILTDESFDDVLICKLCKEILSSNYIICEVTELNRNVMFEYGYAKGLGKHGWLILKRSSKNFLIKKGVFSDVIQLRYSNIDEVAFEIKNTLVLSDNTQIISNPNITGDCKNCNINPDERKCLILTPEIFMDRDKKLSLNIRSISNRIKNIMSGSGYKFDFIKEITEGHILCNYCKKIKESKFVLAIYVPDDIPNSELINSGLAFLIGLALALDKRILILQEKPIHNPMIDLKGAVRDFKDLKELDNKVRNFISS